VHEGHRSPLRTTLLPNRVFYGGFCFRSAVLQTPRFWVYSNLSALKFRLPTEQSERNDFVWECRFPRTSQLFAFIWCITVTVPVNAQFASSNSLICSVPPQSGSLTVRVLCWAHCIWRQSHRVQLFSGRAFSKVSQCVLQTVGFPKLALSSSTRFRVTVICLPRRADPLWAPLCRVVRLRRSSVSQFHTSVSLVIELTHHCREWADCSVWEVTPLCLKVRWCDALWSAAELSRRSSFGCRTLLWVRFWVEFHPQWCYRAQFRRVWVESERGSDLVRLRIATCFLTMK
jgi:hypothetical protein